MCPVVAVLSQASPRPPADHLALYLLNSAPMSAEAALNKSLDDLIAEQRQKKTQASRETERQTHLAPPGAAAFSYPVHPYSHVAEEGDPQGEQASSPGARPSARVGRGPAL